MKTLVTILLTGLSLTRCLCQTGGQQSFKEVNAPNFLVQNQLTPELIKVEYAGGISKGSVKDNAGEKTSLKQNTLTISGYPVALKSKRYTQFYLGFGYSKEEYISSENSQEQGFLDETYESFNLNFFANTRIKDKFFWFLYLQGGTQGTNPFHDFKHSNNNVLLTKVNYRARRNMNVGIGLAYVTNLGKPLVLPSVAFVYSNPRYLINIDFPVKGEVEGIFAGGKWRPVVGVSFPANTYYLTNTDSYFNTQGMTGYAGLRYRVLDFLYLYAAFQKGLSHTFSVGDCDNREEVGTFEGQNRLTVSLNVQVARFIPYNRE